MEDTNEILEIVRPSGKSTLEDSRVSELHDVALTMARRTSGRMAVLKTPDGFEIRPAVKKDAPPQTNLVQKPLINNAVVEAPPPQSPRSHGEQWSHLDKKGNPRGPGSHKKG